MTKISAIAALSAALLTSGAAVGAELEVTHWWTSAGEAAAVAEFARVFEEQTGHTWVDSALAGSGTGANPVIISRIIGGNPADKCRSEALFFTEKASSSAISIG